MAEINRVEIAFHAIFAAAGFICVAGILIGILEIAHVEWTWSNVAWWAPGFFAAYSVSRYIDSRRRKNAKRAEH